MTLSRIWCLLTGGHKRYPSPPLGEKNSWETLVFSFVPPLVEKNVRLQYEPCMKCGEIFLHERSYPKTPHGNGLVFGDAGDTKLNDLSETKLCSNA